MTYDSKDLDKSNAYRYAPSVMSKLSFLPQSKPDSPSVRKTNGNSSITVSASNGEWAYGAAPRMFLLHIRSLIKNGSDCVDVELIPSTWTTRITRSAIASESNIPGQTRIM